MAMTFCSNCGGRLYRAVPVGDALERDVCPGCHMVHYRNPRVLVTCLATWGQRALWIRRAQEPRRGFWSVPGGYTEMGESLQQAAARELREETGVQLSPKELVLFGVGSILHVNQVYVSFRAELEHPRFQATAEAEEVALFSEDELPWDALAFPELTDIIRRFYEELRTGNFGIYMGEYAPGQHYLQRMDEVRAPI